LVTLEFMESIARIALDQPADKISANLRVFFEKSGIPDPFEVQPIQDGRNSRVYQIEKNSSKWILKEYYHQVSDPRNRLETEYNFLSFLNTSSIEHVADAIAKDSDHNCGLYSYLPGKKPLNVNSDFIRQACEFIQKINEHYNHLAVKNLPHASEACFSISAHLNCIRKRVNILEEIVPIHEIEFEVFDFVQKRLVPAHNQVVRKILRNTNNEVLSEKLLDKMRILSPSDFGFQNTLKDGNTLNFLDFEYAGLDDPAKLICDFGCHPEIPVRDEYLQTFKDSFFSWLEDAENVIHRSEIIMPLYRLKWCCIMLNEFTSMGRARRNHAGEMLIMKISYKSPKLTLKNI